ncbi:MAG: endolytic transglycosylase MltG [Syntrophomonadaceae bacterium]|nr:endolytic transglycosylase MltG [Syntrophomonadaceae bacterium]
MSKVITEKPKKRASLFIVVLLLAIIAGSGWQLFNSQFQPVDASDKTYQDVVIPANSTARQIAEILHENSLIHSQRAFLSYCKKQKLDGSLMAGHYRFSRSQPLAEIASAIAAGKVVTISFTIPEGFTVRQIGDLLVEKNIVTRESWDQAVTAKYDYMFLKGLPPGEKGLEGFLFPDTYYISEDISASRIIDAMLSQFDLLWQQEFAALAKSRGQSINEIVTIASLIEGEARVGSERSIISGVIYNRLQRDMLLQIDATILYCLPKHQEVIYYRDLEVDSPYNTYRYPGLPPGPITNPGKESIKAALKPDKHSYLFYVSRGDGSHHFTETYAQHLAAKRQYID